MVKKSKIFEETIEDSDNMPVAKEPVPAALPMVGDIVHFYTLSDRLQYHGDSGPYAAIVTKVNHTEENNPNVSTVDLTVFPSGDMYTKPYDVFGVQGFEEDPQGYIQWWKVRS